MKDINKIKEKFLLISGVQIGSVTPLVSETTDYTTAIGEARKDAIRNAKGEANALASAMNVMLGEPVFITENITYPYYTGCGTTCGTSSEGEITVTVTIYFNIIYQK